MASSTKAPKKEKKQPSSRPAKQKPIKSGAARHKLSAAQRAALLALSADFDAPIDRNVAETQQEARSLESTLAKLGKEIYAKSNLSKEVGQSLEARRGTLEIAEAAWTEHRNASLSKSLREVRAEAEELKRDAIAALRHFREDDSAVLTRVEAIVLGAGIADLIDDLRKLAVLLDENEKQLSRADLPRHPADRARGLAESLSRGSADRAVDPVGAAAMSLRNRAFWSLREAMDAVRSAGRYVYRKQPKLLVAFHASSTRARARAGTVRSSDKPAPAAANGAPGRP
jgi:hypothetical protein